MVGGTRFPPHDSKSEPWSNEQKATPKTKPPTKGKSKPEAALLERSRLAIRSLEVSLDNADTVIEGAPHIAHFAMCGFRHNRTGSGSPTLSPRDDSDGATPRFHRYYGTHDLHFIPGGRCRRREPTHSQSARMSGAPAKTLSISSRSQRFAGSFSTLSCEYKWASSRGVWSGKGYTRFVSVQQSKPPLT